MFDITNADLELNLQKIVTMFDCTVLKIYMFRIIVLLHCGTLHKTDFESCTLHP